MACAVGLMLVDFLRCIVFLPFAIGDGNEGLKWIVARNFGEEITNVVVCMECPFGELVMLQVKGVCVQVVERLDCRFAAEDDAFIFLGRHFGILVSWLDFGRGS